MTQNLDPRVVSGLEKAISVLAPGASCSELVPLFDGRVCRQQIATWRAGRRRPARWALELLATKIDQLHRETRAALLANETGPGRKAGARNLAEYLARRR
jgi:hypothetical protein